MVYYTWPMAHVNGSQLFSWVYGKKKRAVHSSVLLIETNPLPNTNADRNSTILRWRFSQHPEFLFQESDATKTCREEVEEVEEI